MGSVLHANSGFDRNERPVSAFARPDRTNLDTDLGTEPSAIEQAVNLPQRGAQWFAIELSINLPECSEGASWIWNHFCNCGGRPPSCSGHVPQWLQ